MNNDLLNSTRDALRNANRRIVQLEARLATLETEVLFMVRPSHGVINSYVVERAKQIELERQSDIVDGLRRRIEELSIELRYQKQLAKDKHDTH